jgi:hypothetical protein
LYNVTGRRLSGTDGVPPEKTWPTLEEALSSKDAREKMLRMISDHQSYEPWQPHAKLLVEGDFESGRWESCSRRGLLEFRSDGTWAGGGGSTNYAYDLGLTVSDQEGIDE